ncbi:MAG: glycoside hydrolase family 36 protein [Fimbriimonadaceae bacterium]
MGPFARRIEPWVIAEGRRVRWQAVSESRWTAGDLSAELRPTALGVALAIRNDGTAAVALQAAFLRWTVEAPRLRLGFFEGRWARENQLRWIDPPGAVLELRHPPGRTGEGNPTHALAMDADGRGWAWVAAPSGDLLARVVPDGPFLGPHGSPVRLQVWIGPPPEGLHLEVPAGQELEVAECLELPLPDGPSGAARDLSLRCLGAWGPARECPVIWNTWLDRFDDLDLDRLLRQLEAAREVGCEGLVVDAGWFGTGTDWWNCVGDWRECADGAFHGRMAEVADRVRAAGLFIGFWMEPERVAPGAPVARAHPDWVTPAGRLRLERPEAFEWLLETASERISEFGAQWLKVDMNFSLGDSEGDAFRSHRQALARWLRELRNRFPSLYLEGCSSGAMRLDLGALPLFDQHFLSDNTNPWDVARIVEGAALRAPLSRIGRWAVLYERGGELLVPRTAGLSGFESATVPFAVAAAFLGAFGLSGDLASLGAENRRALRECVQAYRSVRSEIAASWNVSAAPPSLRDDRNGWTWHALANPSSVLMVALRLSDASDDRSWQWSELGLGKSPHGAEVLFGDEGASAEATEEGLRVSLPRPNAAIGLRLPRR